MSVSGWKDQEDNGLTDVEDRIARNQMHSNDRSRDGVYNISSCNIARFLCDSRVDRQVRINTRVCDSVVLSQWVEPAMYATTHISLCWDTM